jgi:hypothetical protein
MIAALVSFLLMFGPWTTTRQRLLVGPSYPDAKIVLVERVAR